MVAPLVAPMIAHMEVGVGFCHFATMVRWLATLAVVSVCRALEYNPQAELIPAFVTDHAPLVYLYSEEKYMPGSIAEYVGHFWMSNTTTNSSKPLKMHNINSIADELSHDPTSDDLFMQARHEWKNSDWIQNLGGIPSALTGKIDGCPATLIMVRKEHFIDAFWFYFYPFNEGPYVMGQGPMGNHLADWEHSLVRFSLDGEPQIVWMSAHGGGSAYHWDTIPKQGTRPIIYSARGTHANYVSSGQHSHDIPWHWLSDFTDRGYLWDPAANHLAYTFDGQVAHPGNGSSGLEKEYGDWIIYQGHWGDPKLSKSDPRQHWAVFNWQMIDGPTGPITKNLMRTSPCERHKWWNLIGKCRLRKYLEPSEGIEAIGHGIPFLRHLPRVLQYPLHAVFLNSWGLYLWELLR